MKHKINILLLSVLIIVAIFLPAKISTQMDLNKYSSGTWETRESLPIPISHAAGAVVNNRFYIIGGQTSGGTSISSVYEYNPKNDTWRQKSDFPHKCGNFDCSVFNEKIYIFGGEASNINYDYTYVYDPKSDVWISLQKMPPPARRVAAAVTYENKIYIIGGMTAYGQLPICDIYIPEYNVWSYWRGAEMSLRKEYCSAVTYNNLIYVLGGYNSNGSISTMEVYNINENTWSIGRSLPFETFGARAELIDNWIYLFGGMDTSYFLNDMAAYNPEQDIWITLPDMPAPKAGHMSCVIDGNLYVAGGVNRSQKFNSLEVYIPGEMNVSTVITNVVPDSAYIHQDITIEGYGFGYEKGSSYVTFGGIKAKNYYEWSPSCIKTEVPSGALSGDICVVKDGESSNGFPFKVLGESPIKKIAADAQYFCLEQNYPNPFNDGTTFRFFIPEESFVKLELYDIRGRIVRTFINASLSAGEYQCYWNGKNKYGEAVATGQYIVRLINNKNYSDFIKLLYLK